jgi:hypothetical protein
LVWFVWIYRFERGLEELLCYLDGGLGADV